MMKIKITMVVLLVLFLVASSVGAEIVRRFDAKVFTEKYAVAIQSGDIEALLQMYAPSVKVMGQNQTKEQLRPGLVKSLKGPEQSSIRMVKPLTIGSEGFKELTPGKFSGKVTFQITYSTGKVTKTKNIDVTWTVAHSDGGGDWKIVETNNLFWWDQ